MPLVRIDIGPGHPAGFGRAVGDIVYRAMTTEISVPADDKFQIITQHQATELNIPKSYLGIEYSEGIVFIQVTLNRLLRFRFHLLELPSQVTEAPCHAFGFAHNGRMLLCRC